MEICEAISDTGDFHITTIFTSQTIISSLKVICDYLQTTYYLNIFANLETWKTRSKNYFPPMICFRSTSKNHSHEVTVQTLTFCILKSVKDTIDKSQVCSPVS